MRRGVRLPAETRRGASRPVPIDLPHPQAALACSLPALRLGLGSRRAQEAFFSCSLSQPGAGFPTPPYLRVLLPPTLPSPSKVLHQLQPWLEPCSPLLCTQSGLLVVGLIKHLGAASALVNSLHAEGCLSLDSICSHFPSIFFCRRDFTNPVCFPDSLSLLLKTPFFAEGGCFPGHSRHLVPLLSPPCNKCFLCSSSPSVLNLFQ